MAYVVDKIHLKSHNQGIWSPTRTMQRNLMDDADNNKYKVVKSTLGIILKKDYNELILSQEDKV